MTKPEPERQTAWHAKRRVNQAWGAALFHRREHGCHGERCELRTTLEARARLREREREQHAVRATESGG